MDSRDYLDADGWPAIAYRDRLPLVWLIKGAALTAGFIKAASKIRCNDPHRVMLRGEISRNRDAVIHELPSGWHAAPCRRNRLDSREPP